MKKKDRIFWAVYIVAGMVMMAVGLKLDIEYYSTLLFAIGFSFMTNGLVRVVGNWYHMRPENREEYQEKLRRQQINLKDERKMQLRWRAGYIAWSVTVILCFVGGVCDEPVSEIYGTCGGAVWTGCPGIRGCNRNLQASVQEDVR